MSTYTRQVSSPADPDLSGEVIDGRYHVLEHLASGGMATVYRALDTRLDRDVALKILRPHLAHDAEFVRRFEREARAAARLDHPNIVAILDQGDDDGRLFIAMEYVPGRTLRDVLREEGSLTPRAALDLMDPALAALGHAHQAGFMHRDVKPENVLLRDDGVVKVADFGLARAVSSQTVTSASNILLGTVAYVSPEQVARGIADARSDVYAAGLILFELLTGTKAFDGEVPVNIAFQHVHDDAPRVSARAAGTPRALDDAVAAATARDPDDRPVDGTAFRELLTEVRAGLGSEQLDRRLGILPVPAAVDAAATAVLPQSGSRVEPTATLPAALSPSSRELVPTTTDETPGGNVRKRRWPRVLVALAALLLAASIYLFTVGPLTPTPVPTLTSLTKDQATAALTKAGLKSTTQEAYSEDVAAGVVISSKPAAGTTIWRFSSVVVVVSKGPERYAVPALEKVVLATAIDQVKSTKLSVGTQTLAWSETIPEGSVISSDPAAGTPLKPGAAVNLTVSKGREPIDLADWTGKAYADAAAALTAAGLKPAEGTHQNSDSVPKGSVISQAPARGPLHRGDTVTFVISDGPVLVAVPDVFGRSTDQARQALEALGFKVTVEKLFGGVFGTVREQNPAAGTQIPKGSTVTIRVV